MRFFIFVFLLTAVAKIEANPLILADLLSRAKGAAEDCMLGLKEFNDKCGSGILKSAAFNETDSLSDTQDLVLIQALSIESSPCELMLSLKQLLEFTGDLARFMRGYDLLALQNDYGPACAKAAKNQRKCITDLSKFLKLIYRHLQQTLRTCSAADQRSTALTQTNTYIRTILQHTNNAAPTKQQRHLMWILFTDIISLMNTIGMKGVL